MGIKKYYRSLKLLKLYSGAVIFVHVFCSLHTVNSYLASMYLLGCVKIRFFMHHEINALVLSKVIKDKNLRQIQNIVYAYTIIFAMVFLVYCFTFNKLS